MSHEGGSRELLPTHQLKVAIIHPQIAPNTGNIARLCVATGTELHLVRPLGFVLSDKNLRRSAMDYWPRLKLRIHDDDAALFNAIGTDRFHLLSSKGKKSLFEADFQDGDCLIFGNEGHGLPETLLTVHADLICDQMAEDLDYIPMPDSVVALVQKMWASDIKQ